MRLIATLLTALTVMMTAGAANKVTLSPASGAPGGETTVSVGLENGGGIVAMQLTIPLPDGLDYIDGSCKATGSRLGGHSISAAQNGRNLVILAYDVALKEIAAGSGEVMTFGLRLGKEPGDYTLTPAVRLGNAAGEAVATAVENGTVTIQAPKLSLGATEIDYGRQAIRGSYTRTLTLTNTGNLPLHIGDIASSATTLAVQPAALEIAPGRSGTVTVTYSPTVRAASVTERLTVKSDAVNGDGIVTVKAIPYSVNELHIDAAQGQSGEEVTITARMNNMEPITAADFTIALPKGLEYVAGSAAPAGRAQGHTVTGSVTADGRLRIIMFHPANKAVDGNDGELLTFRLMANVTHGSYRINPEQVKLANVTEENMTSASSGNYLTIASPTISCSSDFDMGESRIDEDIIKPFSISNRGNAPLVIDRVVFLSEGFSVASALPLTIEPYGSAELDVKVAPASSGDFATIMNIYCNDPDMPMKAVNVKGRAYEPNEVTVTGEPSDSYDSYTLHVGLKNYTEIAALQLDIDWLEGMTTAKEDMTLSARAAGHSYEVARIAPGKYRVVIFSLSNTPFTGNDGNLFDITFHGSDFVGSQLTVSGIKLSGKNGKNYTSPDATLSTSAIDPVKATSIRLDRTSAELKEGDKVQLAATVLPSNVYNKKVTWTSSNTEIATVDEAGNVTAIKAGESVITATTADGSGLSAECKVTVLPIAAESISLDATEKSVYEGETFKLTATVLPENTSDKGVKWSSSDPNVATVDENGNVTAIKAGESVITATTADGSGLSAECKVTVLPIAAGSIALNATEKSVYEGETFKLTATVLPENTSDKNVTWSSSDPNVATVDENGNVTAIKAGESVITATTADGSGLTAECRVTVLPIAAESISLDQTEKSLYEGQSFKLTATVLPENTSDKKVTWSSSDASVATVDENGNVTAIKAGESVITATTADGSGLSAECKVTVLPIAAGSISLDATEKSLYEGETFKLTATVLPENTSDKKVTWSSGNPNVATVDENGNVTAIKAGESVITATTADGSGLTAECRVTVLPISAESVSLDATEKSLYEGQSFKLTATVLPENTSDKKVTWSSSNTEVATVDENGNVTAIKAGESVITATTADGSGLTAECRVTVLPIAAGSISLDATEKSVYEGETFKLTATVLPENTSDKGVKWSSSDPNVATVDEAGNVTAIKAGECVITATTADGSGLSAECKVTVMPLSIYAESIYLDITSKSAIEGETFRLTATVLPENTTNKNVEWTSSNAEVATVDEAGMVTVIKAGECVITATTVDGSELSAECRLSALSGIEEILTDGKSDIDVYNINGVLLFHGITKSEFKALPRGLYIINGHKFFKSY